MYTKPPGDVVTYKHHEGEDDAETGAKSKDSVKRMGFIGKALDAHHIDKFSQRADNLEIAKVDTTESMKGGAPGTKRKLEEEGQEMDSLSNSIQLLREQMMRTADETQRAQLQQAIDLQSQRLNDAMEHTMKRVRTRLSEMSSEVPMPEPPPQPTMPDPASRLIAEYSGLPQQYDPSSATIRHREAIEDHTSITDALTGLRHAIRRGTESYDQMANLGEQLARSSKKAKIAEKKLDDIEEKMEQMHEEGAPLTLVNKQFHEYLGRKPITDVNDPRLTELMTRVEAGVNYGDMTKGLTTDEEDLAIEAFHNIADRQAQLAQAEEQEGAGEDVVKVDEDVDLTPAFEELTEFLKSKLKEMKGGAATVVPPTKLLRVRRPHVGTIEVLRFVRDVAGVPTNDLNTHVETDLRRILEYNDDQYRKNEYLWKFMNVHMPDGMYQVDRETYDLFDTLFTRNDRSIGAYISVIQDPGSDTEASVDSSAPLTGGKRSLRQHLKKHIAPSSQEKDTEIMLGEHRTGDTNYDNARRLEALDRTINRSQTPAGVQIIGQQVGFEPSAGSNPASDAIDAAALGFDLASNRSDRYKAGATGGYVGKNVGAAVGKEVGGEYGAAVGSAVGQYWGKRGAQMGMDATDDGKLFKEGIRQDVNFVENTAGSVGSSIGSAGKKVGKKLKHIF
jgi:hypothetical protein